MDESQHRGPSDDATSGDRVRPYPFNGLELDFSRYHHRTLGTQDIMASHVMRNIIFPQKIKPWALLAPVDPSLKFTTIMGQDAELGLDIRALWKQLMTQWSPWGGHYKHVQDGWYVPATYLGANSGPAKGTDKVLPRTRVSPEEFLRRLSHWMCWHCLQCRQPMIEEVLLDMVRQYHFEVKDTTTAAFMRHMRDYHTELEETKGWNPRLSEHVRNYSKRLRETQTRPPLYDGGLQRPSQVTRHKYSLGDAFLTNISDEISGIIVEGNDFHYMRCMKTNRRKRASSVPSAGSWSAGKASADHFRDSDEFEVCLIFFPRLRLAELDKRSRRRSLSQTHIKDMFREQSPDPRARFKVRQPSGARATDPACHNCTSTAHETDQCTFGCGHCGRPNDIRKTSHDARGCPKKPSNRCKCMPFPQFHDADKCKVPCSRPCGSPFYPTHPKHRNAMTCTYRCCMCGLRGHSGKQCREKTCRCGGQHLGQDCRWKVECRVRDCDRYNCGVHCRECLAPRKKGQRFVGGRCEACLQSCVPSRPKADEYQGAQG